MKRMPMERGEQVCQRLLLSVALAAASIACMAQTDAPSVNEPWSVGPQLASNYGKPITIEFTNAPLAQVFDVLSRTSGIQFVFDRDVRTDQRTSIFLKNGND